MTLTGAGPFQRECNMEGREFVSLLGPAQQQIIAVKIKVPSSCRSQQRISLAWKHPCHTVPGSRIRLGTCRFSAWEITPNSITLMA